MFKQWYNKYVGLVVVLCSVLLFYFVLNRADIISGILSHIFSIIQPIVIGLGFAYVLAPTLNYYSDLFRKLLSKLYPNKKSNVKISKALGVLATILTAILFIFGLFSIILPELWNTAVQLIDTLPSNLASFNEWLVGVLEGQPELQVTINNLINSLSSNIQNILQDFVLLQMTEILSALSAGALTLSRFLIDTIVAFSVCIYVLISKDTFIAQTRKVTFAMFSTQSAQKIIRNTGVAHRIFSGFIIGKIIDSAIVGVICFVFTSFAGMPYAVLVSVIVGVTNVIPYFGPFIGAIPSGFLIILVDPMQCLYFSIFILILQQIDGNIIGPKILGDNTGLSSFWVLVSILVGGGLFGFAGILLGVPTFAVIYFFAKEFVENRLRKKGLAVDTHAYFDGFVPKDEISDEEIAPKK